MARRKRKPLVFMSVPSTYTAESTVNHLRRQSNKEYIKKLKLMKSYKSKSEERYERKKSKKLLDKARKRYMQKVLAPFSSLRRIR